jgi:hypothetical protein
VKDEKIMLESKTETKTEKKNQVPNQSSVTDAKNTQRRISAADWLRVVGGFKAPFGHDGLPTVWG